MVGIRKGVVGTGPFKVLSFFWSNKRKLCR